MENIDEEITHKTIMEVNYPKVMIKRVTPYLNDIKYIQYAGTPTEREVNINVKQRAYAWYYVHNGGNQTDAYRRAYYCRYDSRTCKLIPHKDIKPTTLYAGGSRVYRMEWVRRCIVSIREQLESKIKSDIPQTMLQQLTIQSSYDPAMFINVNGTACFESWDEIPLEYRCCVEGIDPKTGKVQLVSREKAREKLLGLAPGLLTEQPKKLEIKHTTVDKEGEEIGINTSNMSDADLRLILQGNKGE